MSRLLRRGLVAALVCALPGAAAAAPLFSEATARLGPTQPCGGTGCYSNALVVADLDGDGDLDAVFANGGGYYEPGDAEPMAIYLNDGKANFSEANATALGGFTGRLRQVTVGDIDGDGDLDLVAPDAWAMQKDAVFVNQGGTPVTFANEGPARLGTSSRAGATRLGDLDGDGDLDLVITDWGDAPYTSPGTAKVYLNDGTGHFTELAGAVPQNTQTVGTGPIDADLFDADGDFDLDLLLASRQGESLLFINGGSGMFTSEQDHLADQPGPYVYGPDACDVDGDGDLDLWLDNGAAPRAEQLLENGGRGMFVDVTGARVTGNVTGADDNEVQCADLDLDGDLDAVIASLDNNERVLANDGAGKFNGTTLAGAFPTVSDPTLGLDLGDLDGDGRLDAVTAQGEGASFIDRVYLGTMAQPVDTRAPTFRAVQTQGLRLAGGQVQVRFAVVDRTTTDVGPRLQAAWLQLPGGVAPAHFVGGDLFQAGVELAPSASVEVMACAKDQAGNQACSAPFTVSSPFSGDDAGAGANDAGSGDDAGGGDDGSDNPMDDCGCRVGGATDRPDLVLGLLLGGLVVSLLLRRRWRR